jgi:hypothetical protein
MIQFISQLRRISPDLISDLNQEIAATEIHWFESFSDYQSGGWSIASLYNATGEETYDVPLETAIKPTPLLQRMPIMQTFLDSTGLNYMMARITRSLPDSYLYEHSDYAGLDKYEKLRLHIPLDTHLEAQMSLTKDNIYLQSGFLWKLDPRSAVHGVYNRGQKPRIHLLLDCYMNPLLASLVRTEWLDSDLITPLPQMTKDKINQVMQTSQKLLLQGQEQQAEHHLLTTFYDYQHLPGYTSYQMIINLYQAHRPESERIAYWRSRQHEVYGGST